MSDKQDEKNKPKNSASRKTEVEKLLEGRQLDIDNPSKLRSGSLRGSSDRGQNKVSDKGKKSVGRSLSEDSKTVKASPKSPKTPIFTRKQKSRSPEGYKTPQLTDRSIFEPDNQFDIEKTRYYTKDVVEIISEDIEMESKTLNEKAKIFLEGDEAKRFEVIGVVMPAKYEEFKVELIKIIEEIAEESRTEDQRSLLANLQGTNNFDFGKFRRIVEPLALALNKDRKKEFSTEVPKFGGKWSEDYDLWKYQIEQAAKNYRYNDIDTAMAAVMKLHGTPYNQIKMLKDSKQNQEIGWKEMVEYLDKIYKSRTKELEKRKKLRELRQG